MLVDNMYRPAVSRRCRDAAPVEAGEKASSPRVYPYPDVLCTLRVLRVFGLGAVKGGC